MLREADVVLSRAPSSAVVVLEGDKPCMVAAALVAGHPSARVTSLPVSPPSPSLHSRLAARGPLGLIVVTTDACHQAADLAKIYREVLLQLAPGGSLLMADVDTERPPGAVVPLIDCLTAVREADELAPADADEAVLAAATRRAVINGTGLTAVNETAALAKLREDEVDFVLSHRGARAGEVLAQIAPETFVPSGANWDYAAEVKQRDPKPIHVPQLSLRQYNAAYCLPRQVTVSGNLLLPDTYRHRPEKRLKNKGTTELSPLFAQVQSNLDKATTVEGSVFQFDSEWSGHFGHLMTEQLSRLWAWRQAKSLFPDVRPVIHRNRPTDTVAPWERGLLEAAGIDAGEVLLITGAIRADRVIAATPMFSQPYYVSPQIEGIWNEVGQGAQTIAGDAATPSRIFVSRRRPARWCHNRDEVEETFAKAGFTVVYPEDLPFAQQTALFRNAELIAGFAGSAMFTLNMCDVAKRVLLVCSQGYIPHNEYLIAAARGHRLDIFWSVPDTPKVNEKFAFDFDREGRHLRRVLNDLH